MKKYELILKDSIKLANSTLFRVRALIDFADVKAGDLGGYIQREKNLSHDGNAWVADNAKVWGEAEVSGDAKVWGEGEVCGKAKVSGTSWVAGTAKVTDNAEISGNVVVWGNAEISGHAKVWENVEMSGNAKVFGNAEISGNAVVWGDVEVFGNAKVSGNTELYGDAKVTKLEDVIVFKNHWSSGNPFTYTKSNKMWKVGCFYGTGQELIEKAYRDSKNSGNYYKAYVDFVEILDQLNEERHV